MQYRDLGATGWKVSTVSFGAWAIGGDWGSVDDQESIAALQRSIELGVNFIDTADVYGDGRSERLVAQVLKDHKDIHVATKAGRRLDPHLASGYNRQNLTAFVERSLKNLATEAIDLLQLHCPPTEVYYMPETFSVLDDLVQAGKLKHYGVSVEKVEEALKAIEFPNVKTVQIIFNIFRQRPAELFFQEAMRKKIGIIVRVPLASGMLTGKMKPNTTFAPDDHRSFNRHGEAFDRGETFAGVDYEIGLQAVEEIRALLPPGWSMPQFALRWILMHAAVSCVIPGAKTPQQAQDNAAAADLPELSAEVMEKVSQIYQSQIRDSVHHYW
ncbi:MAG: aldo/keto reductase [Anaerolineaceae bacterium]|jgi:aryl-alcohol dehydrogenase-like predicted oxidoreductase|nr:aldo/keto reductase [Anaerolineaceae bacterium]